MKKKNVSQVFKNSIVSPQKDAGKETLFLFILFDFVSLVLPCGVFVEAYRG